MARDDTELRPDICVIGGGAGGLAAAAAAAAMGVPVVLIEKGRMGGLNLTGGSIPSKALIAAAESAQGVRSATRFGIKTVRSGIEFALVRAHVSRAVDAVALQDSAARMRGLGVRVIEGTAHFRNADTVVAAGISVKARRFIIATGASPVLPPIPGLAETPYLTAESAFGLIECPRHLIVLGAGRSGLELAQAFRRLGAEVTVLEPATPLQREDGECAAVVLDALEREGIKLRTGVRVIQVRRTLGRTQVVTCGIAPPAAEQEETLEGSHLLVAGGRRPNIDDLDLDLAGIRHGPDGIVVDRQLRTSNKHVYAVGDVLGGRRFAHIAAYQAGIAVRNIVFRHRVRADQTAIPGVIYTDPQLAQVGLREEEGRLRAGAICVLRWSYRENDRATTAGTSDGHIKVVTDRRGRILGATIVGPQASEVATAWALAIGQNLNIAAMASLATPYPSYAEVGKRAAITYFMRGLTAGRVRRIMGWLRRLG